jgi:Leucine-rich repeat (LRR) protein
MPHKKKSHSHTTKPSTSTPSSESKLGDGEEKNVHKEKEKVKTEKQQRRAYDKQERERIAVEKRKKVVAKRFNVWSVHGVKGRLDELLKKEQTLSIHVKKFPLDLEKQTEHRKIIKEREVLESQVPPFFSRVTNKTQGNCKWLVREGREFDAEDGVEYYELNLRLCRLTKLRWFPHHGKYPGPEDGDDHGKRWYCLKLDASVNQLSNLDPGKLELMHELRYLNLKSNQIMQIGDGLRGLAFLRQLDISNNYIEKIDGLSSCVRLTHLDLSSNKLSAIKNLGRLKSLKILKLNGNKLVRLRGLDKLKSLTDLHMDRNELIDISHLALVPTIKSLHLRENSLGDMDKCGLVFVSLTNLSQLYVEGNPICNTRDFRLRVLENTRITKLDAVTIKSYLREYLREIKRKDDLEDIVNQTTEDYMARLDQQKEQKTANLEILRNRESELETAFQKYREEMEKELQECISYIHSLDTREDLKKQSFIATDEGMQEWKQMLEKEGRVRDKAIAALKARQQIESIESVATKSGVVKYTEKLKELAKLKPGVWREMKRREYQARNQEIATENRLNKRRNKEQRTKRKRVKERQSLRQRHMLDHIDDYEVASDQWWDKNNPKGDGNAIGSSPQRLHHREGKKHNFEDGRDTSDGEELQALSESEKEDNSRPNSRAEGKITTENDTADTKTNDGDAGAKKDGDVGAKKDGGSKKVNDDGAGSSSDEDEDGNKKQKKGNNDASSIDDAGRSKIKDGAANVEEKGSVYKVTYLNPGKGGLGLAIAESADKNREGVYVKATAPNSVSANTKIISQGHKLLSICIDGEKAVDISKSNKKETMDVLKSQKIGAGKAKKSLILEFKDFAGKINAEISIDVAKGGKSKPIPKSSPKKKKKGLFW